MDRLTPFLQSKSGLVVAALLALLVLERLFPVARAIGGLRRITRNLSLAGINAILSWLIVVPVSAFAADWALDWRPSWLSGWPGLLVDLLLLDFWIYWWHRLNHKLPFLWRFHQVHHMDEFLDASSALRFHFGEVLLSSMVRAAVILLTAIPLTSVIIFETLLALVTMFHHSNLRLPLGLERPLSYFIVTPSIHWIHHHALRADTDSNYSALLSVWDRLFSSRSKTARVPELKIGLEGRSDEDLASLALRPFRNE